MALTLNDLTVGLADLPRETLLEDWLWLIGPRKLPILITALGDAFIQDADDDSVHLLSPGPGTITKVADDVATFRRLLTDQAFVVDNFAPNIVAQLRSAGALLKNGQLYSYRVPPVLGGKYAIDNLEPTDISVHFAVLGQIHKQARELPEGTPISGVRLTDD